MKTSVALCYRHPRLVFAFVYAAEPYSEAELQNLEDRANYQAGIYGITAKVMIHDNPANPKQQAFLVIPKPASKATDWVMQLFMSKVFSKDMLVTKWETDNQKIGEALEIVSKMIG